MYQKRAEVDIILERDGGFYPIEIKCKSIVNKHDARGIHAFYDTFLQLNAKHGLIIYAGEQVYPVTERVLAVLWHLK